MGGATAPRRHTASGRRSPAHRGPRDLSRIRGRRDRLVPAPVQRPVPRPHPALAGAAPAPPPRPHPYPRQRRPPPVLGPPYDPQPPDTPLPRGAHLPALPRLSAGRAVSPTASAQP